MVTRYFFNNVIGWKCHIHKFNVMTPGREEEIEEVKVVTKDNMNECAEGIIEH